MQSRVGLLDAWDRRNQRIVEKQNERDDVVAAGGISIFAGSAFVKIAAITIPLGVILIAQWRPVPILIGIGVLALGAVLLVSLGRDFVEDRREYKRQRHLRTRKDRVLTAVFLAIAIGFALLRAFT